jgi:hypothetical protein
MHVHLCINMSAFACTSFIASSTVMSCHGQCRRQHHRQNHLGSAIISKTQQHQRATENIALAAPLLTLARQHHR